MKKLRQTNHNVKDGLAISQDKALQAMGFERPDPLKSSSKWNNLNERQSYLETKERKLENKEKSINDKIKKGVLKLFKNRMLELFNTITQPFIKRFKGKHQNNIISIIEDIPIDETYAKRLSDVGYPYMDGLTIKDALKKGEAMDIRDALHDAGADYEDIGIDNVDVICNALDNGAEFEEVVDYVAHDIINSLDI